jgi:hypothetical protein
MSFLRLISSALAPLSVQSGLQRVGHPGLSMANLVIVSEGLCSNTYIARQEQKKNIGDEAQVGGVGS